MPKIVTSRSAVVYMATNCITNEIYIGFTSMQFSKRKSQHIRYALAGRSATVFARAIKQYGPDKFKWEIIAEYENGLDATKAEGALIRALNPDYNGTKGGLGFKPRVVSEEEKVHLRQVGLDNIETFRKYASLGPAASSRRVVCLNDGKMYESASAAALAYGAKKSAVIEVCLRRAFRKTAAGRLFRYEDDDHETPYQVRRLLEKPKKTCKNGSPYSGVFPHVNNRGEDTGRWRARLSVGSRTNPKNLHLGIFDTAEEAKAARDRAMREKRGKK